MTEENLIFIKGGAYNDIKKALRQWIDLYAKDLQVGLAFLLYKNGRGNHVIQVDKNLDNTRFFFLVNYLKYPENIDYNVEVEGFTLGKDDNIFKGEKLLVYISLTDTEGDNVFVTTAKNKHYKFDFGGKIVESREKKRYLVPNSTSMEYAETLKVRQKVKTKSFKNKDLLKNEIEIRFKLISSIIALFMFIGLIIQKFNPQIFKEYGFIFGMGIGLWFFVDYKMLQFNKLYIYSLGIAFCFLLYILFYHGSFDDNVLDYGALYPISFLLIQKPTRFFFMLVFKREPVINKPILTFGDGLYMIVLFIGLVVFPFILIHILTK